MKKWYLLLIIILCIPTIISCQSKKNTEENEKVNITIPSSRNTEEKSKEIEKGNISENTYKNRSEIKPIMDHADEWSTTLGMDGQLTIDLNGDGQDDDIKIEYMEQEGSQYIAKFEVIITGSESSFTIKEYDASFEKLELFDFNQDNVNELVIMFDTHGGGGQGTHDIYVVWLDSDKVITEKINLIAETLKEAESTWNIDGVYDIEKVQYNGAEKMLTRQYVWGKEGHVDAIGDILSIVSFDKERNSFGAEESWIEKAE